MKHSEFTDALREVFGSYGFSLAADLVLDGMDQRTADQALADGVDPQLVWDAICRTAELPESIRFPHRADKKAKKPRL